MFTEARALDLTIEGVACSCTLAHGQPPVGFNTRNCTRVAVSISRRWSSAVRLWEFHANGTRMNDPRSRSQPPAPPTPDTGPRPVLHFHVPATEPEKKLENEWARFGRAFLLRGSRRKWVGIGTMVFALTQAAIIGIVALQPLSALPASTQWLASHDKLVHGLAFAWLGYWSMVGLHHTTRWAVGWSCLATILLIGVGYGAGIEIAQYSMHLGRNFELIDIMADTIGCVIAASTLVLTSSSSGERTRQFAARS